MIWRPAADEASITIVGPWQVVVLSRQTADRLFECSLEMWPFPEQLWLVASSSYHEDVWQDVVWCIAALDNTGHASNPCLKTGASRGLLGLSSFPHVF